MHKMHVNIAWISNYICIPNSHRIHYVVGNACVKVWATKILAEFQHYLEAAEGGVDNRSKLLEDTVAGSKACSYNDSVILCMNNIIT